MTKIRVLEMRLDNFKGASHKTIELSGENASINGQNGSGKTTIADAYFWVFSDRNYDMDSNPVITPLGKEECVTTVEIELSIDGRPVTVSKSQTFKTKVDDTGKVTSSNTNSYTINSVNKSYKDFVADMTERGFNFDLFLALSHPDSFTADTSKKGRDDMRKVLFGMVEDITDTDLIAGMPEMDELKELLAKGYRVEEIEQMQKSTLRKILETCGKDNAVINAKIDGMLSSKADYDITALNAEKDEIQAKIDAYKADIDRFNEGNEWIAREIADLGKRKAEIIAQLTAEYKDSIKALESEIQHLDTEKTVACSEYDLVAIEVARNENSIKLCKQTLNEWRELYKKAQDEVLSESELKCPTCGREYDPERLEEIKESFASSKNERMNSYKKRGEEEKADIEKLESAKADAEKKHHELHEKIAKLTLEIKAKQKELNEKPALELNNDEIREIDKKIVELESKLASDKNVEIAELHSKIGDLKATANELNKKIGVYENNATIDSRVEELRKERQLAEINRAKAEKILNQVEKFNMGKNTALSSEVNKHFELVDFKLFDIQKNGNIKDICEATIDGGKTLTSHSNGSLRTLARLDIIAGLQDYYGIEFPVFADDFSLLTENTEGRITLKSQLVKLYAVNGISEIIVETEG